MDFLLECIGFPPSVAAEEIVALAQERGEPAPWRGRATEHLLLRLGSGLQVRADRDPEHGYWSLTPFYEVPHRLRLSVQTVIRPQDSPYDALLSGWAAPPPPWSTESRQGAYRLSTWISDARRLGRRVQVGQILAVSVAGFALSVDRVLPPETRPEGHGFEDTAGASVRPIGEEGAPGGCCDVSLRVQTVRRILNEVTGEEVEMVVCAAPERPLVLFLSRWQLERDGLPAPRAGWRVEGTFLMSGRLSGGLRSTRTDP